MGLPCKEIASWQELEKKDAEEKSKDEKDKTNDREGEDDEEAEEPEEYDKESMRRYNVSFPVYTVRSQSLIVYWMAKKCP